MENRNTAIALQGVRVDRGPRTVLSSFDLLVEHGERVIVAGRNGSGKTTLLKAVLGLLPHQEGEISVLGVRVGDRRWRRRRGRLGYVHQESVDVDLPVSAYEVAEIGACLHTRNPRRRRSLVLEAMRLTGCAHLAPRLYAQLSGGERQKVSLARCLSQHAEILLLDEPTTSLDPASRGELMSLLEGLSRERGITILMATHDTDILTREGWRIRRLENGGAAEGENALALSFPAPDAAS